MSYESDIIRSDNLSPEEKRRIDYEKYRFTPKHKFGTLLETLPAVENIVVESDVPKTVLYELKDGTLTSSYLQPNYKLINTCTFNNELKLKLNIHLKEGTKLNFVFVNTAQDDAKIMIEQVISLEKEAELKHFAINLGSKLSRFDLTLNFAGEWASADFIGTDFLKNGQFVEHHIDIIHSHKNCRSNVNYKRAFKDSGTHGVWVADALILPNASGTNTYVNNRNLALTKGVIVDSVPNLEILTGDIEKAGHASSTGKFESDQLFYLMSRGITEFEAKKLVLMGFFAETISQINDSISLKTSAEKVKKSKTNSQKTSTERVSTGKTSTGKTSTEKISTEKTSIEKTSIEKMIFEEINKHL